MPISTTPGPLLGAHHLRWGRQLRGREGGSCEELAGAGDHYCSAQLFGLRQLLPTLHPGLLEDCWSLPWPGRQGQRTSQEERGRHLQAMGPAAPEGIRRAEEALTTTPVLQLLTTTPSSSRQTPAMTGWAPSSLKIKMGREGSCLTQVDGCVPQRRTRPTTPAWSWNSWPLNGQSQRSSATTSWAPSSMSSQTTTPWSISELPPWVPLSKDGLPNLPSFTSRWSIGQGSPTLLLPFPECPFLKLPLPPCQPKSQWRRSLPVNTSPLPQRRLSPACLQTPPPRHQRAAHQSHPVCLQPDSVNASWATAPLVQSSHCGLPNQSHKVDHNETYSNNILVSSSVKDGVLYRRLQDPQRGTVEQLVLPSTLKPDVLASLHDNMGHQGLDRTTELLRARVYWPGMFGEVRSYIHACQRCTMGRKPATSTTSGHLIASRPLEVLAIDFTKLDRATTSLSWRTFLPSSRRPYPPGTKKPPPSPKSWSMNGFSGTVFRNGSTATRDETSNPVWWESGAIPTTSRRPERRRTTLRETPNASVSTAACTVCCVRCLRSRSPGGLSICRSWSRRTTTRLTPRPASHPTSCSSDRSPDCRWTTRAGTSCSHCSRGSRLGAATPPPPVGGPPQGLRPAETSCSQEGPLHGQGSRWPCAPGGRPRPSTQPRAGPPQNPGLLAARAASGDSKATWQCVHDSATGWWPWACSKPQRHYAGHRPFCHSRRRRRSARSPSRAEARRHWLWLVRQWLWTTRVDTADSSSCCCCGASQ